MTRPPHIPGPSPRPAPPELLAPAGNAAMALVAFKHGADAVYAGLQRFNARERAENFSTEAFARLVAYARDNGKRVYLTLNTLLKEQELHETADLLHTIESIRPHAVIVQDLGVVRMIREYFPRLALHASTQMGIHNSAGVRVAAARGIRRVILERQVTLDELRRIALATDIELEVFVHGALCCSLSGQCLFSSWMGGWSGNRGRCKQPCRRRFRGPDGNGFFFSTGDLYTLDRITELEQLGVVSLKIEGRMQTAEYVKQVVRAYRLILDTEAADRPEALKEARTLLADALGRKWTRGFLSTAAAAKVIQPNHQGVSGLLCGRVAGVRKGGFEVTVSRAIRLGDQLRIQPPTGEEGPAFTVTRLAVDRRPVKKIGRGQVGYLFCDKEVHDNALVYKTGRAATTATGADALPEPEEILDIRIAVTPRGMRGTLRDRPGEWTFPLTIEPARQHPLDPADVADEFRKAVPRGYGVAEVSVHIEGPLFLGGKQLRELRQSFWTWAAEAARTEVAREAHDTGCERFAAEYRSAIFDEPPTLEVVTRIAPGQTNPVPDSLTARPVRDADAATDEIILPAFCPESGLAALRRQLATCMARGARRFRVTSLYGFDLLGASPDLILSAGFPLPVANSMAVRELHALGVRKATLWIELEAAAVDAVRERVPHGLEIFTYGRPPLLVTRAAVPAKGDITDLRGARFTVERAEGMTRVYPGAVMTLPAPPGCSRYIDLSHADLEEEVADRFNTDRAWD